jgi:hypothetical protein
VVSRARRPVRLRSSARPRRARPAHRLQARREPVRPMRRPPGRRLQFPLTARPHPGVLVHRAPPVRVTLGWARRGSPVRRPAARPGPDLRASRGSLRAHLAHTMPPLARCRCSARQAPMGQARRSRAPIVSGRLLPGKPHRRPKAEREPVAAARRTVFRRHRVRARTMLRRQGIAGMRECRLERVAPRSAARCPGRPRFRCTACPARRRRRIRSHVRRALVRPTGAGASRTQAPTPRPFGPNQQGRRRMRRLRSGTPHSTVAMPPWLRNRDGSALRTGRRQMGRRQTGRLSSLAHRRSPNCRGGEAATARRGRVATGSPTRPRTRPGCSRTPSDSSLQIARSRRACPCPASLIGPPLA